MASKNQITEIDNVAKSASCDKGGINLPLQDLIDQLFQEFDYLGICGEKPSDVPSYVHLITNTFKLTNIHRKTIAQLNNIKIERATIIQDNYTLQKKIDYLEKQQAEKQLQYDQLRRKFTSALLECENSRFEKDHLQKQLQQLREHNFRNKRIPLDDAQKSTLSK